MWKDVVKDIFGPRNIKSCPRNTRISRAKYCTVIDSKNSPLLKGFEARVVLLFLGFGKPF
jgi:hypothetical protein